MKDITKAAVATKINSNFHKELDKTSQSHKQMNGFSYKQSQYLKKKQELGYKDKRSKDWPTVHVQKRIAIIYDRIAHGKNVHQLI